MINAKEIIEKFWKIQDEGDYTKVIELFSEDAVFEDPIYGTFNGKEEILEFMKKMNIMRAINTVPYYFSYNRNFWIL